MSDILLSVSMSICFFRSRVLGFPGLRLGALGYTLSKPYKAPRALGGLALKWRALGKVKVWESEHPRPPASSLRKCRLMRTSSTMRCSLVGLGFRV